MKLEDAEDLALTLMEDNGVGTWSFHFDNAKRRCGACFYQRCTITLSRHFVTMNDEADVRDTVLHEIAHALAGAKAGHGPKWQMQAIRLGAKPGWRAQNVDMPEGSIEGVCAPDCTTRHVRHRMPPKRLTNAYSCNRCYEPVTWVRMN
jgi:predicted SprT family Zn-dependent metalloprotease